MEIDSYAKQALSSWPLIRNLKALKKSEINTILSWYFINLLDLNIWKNLQIYDWDYNEYSNHKKEKELIALKSLWTSCLNEFFKNMMWHISSMSHKGHMWSH
jgi:hypothetical protein